MRAIATASTCSFAAASGITPALRTWARRSSSPPCAACSSDQEIAFKPWIYEIAKNACIDEHRRSQRRHEVSLDAEAELSSGHGALLSIAPTPPAAMESKQKLDDLRSAFGGLSKNHHQLLVMREFEGLSYDEIGRRMGMSLQMVERVPCSGPDASSASSTRSWPAAAAACRSRARSNSAR
jgi:DNA-directed RNA polymerase specialized sigma24 family protein